MLSDCCLSCPVCAVLSTTFVYCGHTVGWIKMKLDMEVVLGPGHIVLDGDLAPPSMCTPPTIGACALWPNGWMEQDATCYGGRSRPWPHCIIDGDPAFLYKKGGRASPNFRPISIVAKRLDASRCHLSRRLTSAQATFCSMGMQLPPEIGHIQPHPSFDPCLLWPKGWMDQDATWFGGKRRPRRRCVRWGRSSPLKGAHSPVFGSCLLWPNGWMDDDAT